MWGLSFANPWGLLALLSLPGIVYLHMFHRRLPRLEIAGLHLWSLESQPPSSGRRREKLPLTWSLLCELLAALLISLLLSQPRFTPWDRVPHVVVVLDNSASMLAEVETLSEGTEDQQTSLRALAIAHLDGVMGNLARNAQMTILRTGRRPTLVAGPNVSWEEAKGALVDWSPEEGVHDFNPAWDLAMELAGDEGTMIFLTDHVDEEAEPIGPKRMEIVAVGKGLPNLAITTANWSFDPQTLSGQIYLRIKNYGVTQASYRVVGTTQKEGAATLTQVFESTETLEADAELPLQLTVPGGIGELTIRLESSQDCLPLDSKVELIEPKPQRLTIAIAEGFEESWLEIIKRTISILPEVQVGQLEDAQLVIAPANVPVVSRESLFWLGIGGLKPEQTPVGLLGPYLLEKRNPLLDSVTLGGVIWAGVREPDERQLTPLISSGSKILFARQFDLQTQAYWLNIDLAGSTLVDSPDWPILMINLVEACRVAQPGLKRWNYRNNERIRFAIDLPDEDSTELPRLIGPSSTRTLPSSEIVELPVVDQSGVYEVTLGESSLARFAVNFFDREESDLKGLSTGRQESREVVDPQTLDLSNLYTTIIMILLIVLVAAILADWYVLGRRKALGARS